ncbi:hypothetical protein LTR84_005353 [Exophiala bonariae]|uniref:Protein arginine N-methyltransferase n=1 Tax=Exophiala bonariae TaxID=1690606 RepID=A0AAV9N6Y6_9EURO|nr:hypothetical protein LTR84_005353 [Exophiala bonariae]
MDDFPHFVIGHHDSKRPLPVTSQTVQNAHAANYDMLTSPITSPHFQSRVLTLLSTYLSQAASSAEDITKTKNASPVAIPPLTPADTPLTPDDSISQIIGISSSWIDLTSPDPIVADISRQVLNLELAYAAFCGITYLLIPGPNLRGHGTSDSAIAQYGRAIMDALSQAPYVQIYIWQSILDHSEEQVKEMGDLSAFARQQFLENEDLDQQSRLDLFGTWEAWDIIRSICKYHARLGVALSMPKLLPPVAVQSRWYSEPVRLLTLDNKIFAKNAKGYPVLSRAHQAMISRFMRLRTPPWFLLCDVGSVPSSNSTDHDGLATNTFPTIAEAAQNPQLKDPTPQLSYMRNLQTKQPILTPLDKFGAGYQDYLQAPLQPLTVNLESITYEVFEKDPIKYAWYERAIARALHDWIEQGKPTSNPDGRVVVAVVGAGRGPLVTRALKASEDVSVEIDMWALEKNPNAFVLLQRHNETIWNNRVKLVKSDMRTWRGPIRAANNQPTSRVYNTEQDDSDDQDTQQKDDRTNSSTPAETGTFTGSPSLDSTYLLATSQPTNTPATPYKIDILISELLGSFADNELSPECLDGVQHLMNPVHGISIPASYTAHLTPIAAPKLYADITHGMTSTTPNAAEIPYVVMLNAIDYLSTTAGAGGTSDSTSSDVPSGANKPQSPSSVPSPPSYAQAHTQQRQQQGNNVDDANHPSSSETPQPIIGTTWSFQHPNPLLPSCSSSSSTSNPSQPPPPSSSTDPLPPISNAHNARHSTLTFPIPHRGTCHGLAGYFETVLYKGVELSTNPATMDAKSEGMISWFPIYFPLKVPLTVPDHSELRVTMWRKTDDRRVWYEWIVDVFISVGVGAGAGAKAPAAAGGKKRARRVRVGGSELHSSEKDACLM